MGHPQSHVPRKRVFYVIYVEDKRIGSCLDAVRLLCDPSKRTRAHITVRGPYSRKLGVQHVRRFNKVLQGETVRIGEPGSFFEHGQNTVFLRCESPSLQSVWHKPDYGYNPHLTLYDGDSRLFAEELLAILRSRKLTFCVRSLRLTPLFSVRGQHSFGLKADIEANYASQILGSPLPLRGMEALRPQARLTRVREIWHRLAQVHQRCGGEWRPDDCVREEDLVAFAKNGSCTLAESE